MAAWTFFRSAAPPSVWWNFSRKIRFWKATWITSRTGKLPPIRASRAVKDELRRNLFRAIEKGETLFPGVHGYEDTVIPQIVNALLSRHNFILLGLRGQAKS